MNFVEKEKKSYFIPVFAMGWAGLGCHRGGFVPAPAIFCHKCMYLEFSCRLPSDWVAGARPAGYLTPVVGPPSSTGSLEFGYLELPRVALSFALG